MKSYRALMQACLLSALLLLALPAVMQAQFRFTTHNGAITVTDYTGSNGVVTIPSSIEGLPVTSIGNRAFFATSVISVLIPDSVINIGYEAFSHSSSLTNVTLGSALSSIGIMAFSYCPKLTSVCCRGNAPRLEGRYVFKNSPATIYYLSGSSGWSRTFGGCPTVLWNPEVPYGYTTNDGTITITGYTGSSGAVTIPSSINFLPVTSIDDYVFISTGSLTNVMIGANVAHVGRLAFYDCSSLVSLTGLDNVTSIEDQAFEFCKNVTGISISENTTNIGIGVFANCSSLTNFTIPSKVTAIGKELFLNCTKLIRVTMGSQVTSIGDYSFYGCASLTNIMIPTSVTTIGNAAFAYCSSLDNVMIPNRVASIGGGAFNSCANLKEIFFAGNPPSIGDSFIFFNATNVTVYYLPGTTGWETTFAGRPTALWLPAMQTSDASFGVQTNQFGFNIQWAIGQVVVVEASTNLSNPDWQPVQTNMFATGSVHFSDPQWRNYSGRFYRLRAP